MPFLLIGIVVMIIGIYFYIASIREKDRDGMVGSIGLIVAGILLIVVYGLFYRSLINFGS